MQNKKKIFLAFLGALSITLLSACGLEKDPEKLVFDAKEVFGNDVLNVYNWGEYIGEDVVSEFEEMYNCKVNYDYFDSNEILYTRLMGGNSYDVLFPSDYMIGRLIDNGTLQKLDFSKIPNIAEVNPQVMEMRKTYDPNGEYSVPYFWGSVGIVYNKKKIDPEKVKKEGWEILRDPEYKDRVFAYDSQRDMFMVALKALGYSMNTEDDKETKEAYEWLIDMNKKVHPAFVTDEVIDAMANGEMDMAIMYSGDAAYVLGENPSMAWCEPWQGTNIWSDGMVVPKNANNPGLAMEFINFMCSYEASLENSDYVGYTASNKKAMDYVGGEEGSYYRIPPYFPRSNYDKDEVFSFNEKINRKQADLWNKVKMSN